MKREKNPQQKQSGALLKENDVFCVISNISYK